MVYIRSAACRHWNVHACRAQDIHQVQLSVCHPHTLAVVSQEGHIWKEGAGGTAGAVVTHSHEIMNYYMYRASLIVCIATPTTVVTDV